MKKRNRHFTLLEVMIGIAILAIVSGSIFFNLQRMVERKRFDSDSNRLKSTLVSTRSLAINTKMDFSLELKETKEGWSARLLCREDPDLVYRLPRFSPLKISFNKKPVQEMVIDFYSSGFVGPKGLLTLSKGPQSSDFKFPELFYRQEDLPLIPLHPSELKEQ